MWSTFIRAALVAVALAGCGPRALDVTIAVDASGCTLSIPAGGSLLYQVEANGSGAGAFCGGCLAVNSAITTSAELVAFVQAQAPSCAGVHPNTTFGVRITGWTAGGCPATVAPSFCADGPTVLVGDGTSNDSITLELTCMPQCSSVCVPTTCAAQGADCGAISDGCNSVLDCGTCHPPLHCGATTPNVCGR